MLNGLTPAKLIFQPMSSFVGVASFVSSGGASETIKSALTSALSTAGRGGVAVPLQAAVDSVSQATFVEGIIATDGLNRATVYAGGTKKRFQDGNGNDVYGKVTQAGSDWVLAYFSFVAGVETAFTMPASTSIDFDVAYLFTFAHYPSMAGTSPTERHVAPDIAAYGWRETTDQLTISATNTTTTALSKTFDGRKATVNLYGIIFSAAGQNPAFSINASNQFVWNATNAGTPLDAGDPVLLTYTY